MQTKGDAVNEKGNNGNIRAKSVPQFQIVDKDGNVHGPFKSVELAMGWVAFNLPDQEQDEDRTGNGWDIEAAR